MKKNASIIRIVLSIAIHQQTNCQEALLQGQSFFNPRWQTAHSQYNLIGIHPFLYQADRVHCETLFNITPLYRQSVRPKRIAQALFGKDTLTIAGSNSVNARDHDLLADYFGLSPNFLSTVTIKPFIKNMLCNATALWTFDNVRKGLYTQITIGFGFTRWKFDLETENILDSGSETLFPAGYQAATTTPLAAPFNSFRKAIAGNTPFGAIQQGLQKGIVTDSHTKKGFADLSCILGYNAILAEDTHLGFYTEISAPTGNKPKGTFLFEPLLGNNRHWVWGFGCTGHIRTWQTFEQELNLFGSLSISHIFQSTQIRSFDFTKNGLGSRYLLLKEFDGNGNPTGNVVPAINITTLPCSVRNDLQVDITVMLGYTYNQLVVDVGYNGWMRSKDKISVQKKIPNNTYGIKGIQNIFDVTTLRLDSTTQSTATIAGNDFSKQGAVADANPIFIATTDLNIKSAASPRLLTHTFFWYLGYSWPEALVNKKISPFAGAGFDFEFEGSNERASCQPYRNTLSQWSTYIKTGITF